MKGGTPRSRTLWTFAITSLALVMVTLDNLVVSTALPVIREGPARRHRGARVDGQRLHAHLRRAAPDRRRARRPLRAPADVRDRPRDLHARLGGGRARPVDRTRSSRPGRCRASAARSSLPLTLTILSAAVPAEKRGVALGAWGGIGGLAVALGPLVGGAVVSGLSWQWIFWINVPIGLVLIPLALAAPRRDVRPDEQARPARPRPRQRRPARDRLGSRPRERPGLDEPGDRRLARGRRRAGRRCSSLWELRTETPMLPMRFFRNRTFATDERRLAADVLRDVRLDLPARAVLPDRAGLLALRLGAADPAVDGDADLRRADRRGALRPDRRPAADGASASRSRRSGSAGSRRSSTPDRRRTAELVAPFVLSGIGMALFFAPVANVVLSSVRPEEEGQASGANNAIRELGGVFGVAVLASIFAHYGGYGSGQTFVDGLNAARSGSGPGVVARRRGGRARDPAAADGRSRGAGRPAPKLAASQQRPGGAARRTAGGATFRRGTCSPCRRCRVRPAHGQAPFRSTRRRLRRSSRSSSPSSTRRPRSTSSTGGRSPRSTGRRLRADLRRRRLDGRLVRERSSGCTPPTRVSAACGSSGTSASTRRCTPGSSARAARSS